ncbi:hypothetical protein FP2506_18124 [Fulvimarina pelagi HTCC2506]|uniref:Flagellar basal-body rod protein FlgF n=1 Tax=Fulvimarina pelagi HTCC2506 TaxID=314231 RepID=Q0G108_9HYPH|nr:DUF1217 domain-containing protein [Fulvimarina pelagi]EAU40831.1 hypothetical protein FP2506_18124 [Fulvimarina pelagi HTCC2506]
MLDASLSYRLISRDLPASLERTAQDPTVERASQRYLEEIGKISSIDEFLANDRVYRYAMKAMGLEDMTYAKAFMRKVMEEGIDDREAFANKLTDSRYKDFAETFNFNRYGEAALAFERTQQGIVDKYVRQTLEENTGTESEGARLALYFERKASTVTSYYGLLADPAILKVMQTAFSIPAETGTLDIDKQADLFRKALPNIEDLKDPQKVSELLQRFTTLWDVNNVQAAPTSPLLQLFGNGSGVSGDLLLTLQTYRNTAF